MTVENINKISDMTYHVDINKIAERQGEKIL